MSGILERFDKPVIDPTTTWSQVFEVYNNNFDKLYDYLKRFDASYTIETHIGVQETLILDNEFTPRKNQLMVFVDGVIQWLGTDYVETGTNSIRFLTGVASDSEVRVIITETGAVINNLDTVLEDRLARIELTLIEIKRLIEGGDVDTLVCAQINELIVSYFENRTIQEVET